MSGQGEVVCVTKASGYIASCLVKLLLQHCYTIKAIVLDVVTVEAFMQTSLIQENKDKTFTYMVHEGLT